MAIKETASTLQVQQ